MKHILINATALNSAGGRSIALNFIKNLLDFYANANVCNFFVYVPSGCGYEEEVYSKGNLKIIYISKKMQKWYLRTKLEHFLKKEIKNNSIDVIFSMGNIALNVIDLKQVLLIHWPYLVYPESKVWQLMPTAEKIKRLLRKKVIEKRLKYVNKYFFQTETMKDRFVNLYVNDIKHFSYAIIPNSVSLSSSSNIDSTAFKELIFDRTKDKTIFLCLTRYYVHKNLEILLEVAKIFKEKRENKCILITIDKNQGKGAKILLNKINEYHLNDYLINIGEVNWNQVPTLYEISKAIILPTFLESYSGIYIESMKFNKRIITSNLDFAKEICKDFALYFDPFDANDIYDKVNLFLKEPSDVDSLEKGYRSILKSNKSWKEITDKIMSEILST